MTGVKIVAADSPVTLYVYTGSEMDGQVSALHCDEGFTCTASWTQTIGSLNCQRDFGHKSLGGLMNQLDNPILPIGEGVSEMAAPLQAVAESSYWVEEYMDGVTELRWATGRQFDHSFGFSTTWTRRYNDHLHLHKEATIDPNWWPSDYDIQLDYWMGPVLDGGTLAFWWAGTNIDVESGTLQGLIGGVMADGVASADLQGLINQGVVDAVNEASFGNADYVLGNKQRLQLSHVSDLAGNNGVDWMPWTQTSSTSPDIQLNQTRSSD
jgi:hypothetical protein